MSEETPMPERPEPQSFDAEGMFARLKAELQPPGTTVDPTPNVMGLVAAAMKRQDDLRDLADKWSERLRATEERCDLEKQALREKLSVAESDRIDARNLAEARRLDAVNAENKAAIALTSERATATAATLAASQASDRNLANDRMTRLEQQQYQTGGRDIQKGASSTDLKGNITIILSAVAIVAALLVAFLR